MVLFSCSIAAAGACVVSCAISQNGEWVVLVRASTRVSHCSRYVIQAGIIASDYLIPAGYGQCEQNFVLPGFNLPQIQDNVDYDVSLCFTCNQNSFLVEVIGSGGGQMSVTSNSSVPGVMLSTTFVPGKFVLVIPVPQIPFNSSSATIACAGESYRISKLGVCSMCVSLFVCLSVHICMCSTYGLC